MVDENWRRRQGDRCSGKNRWCPGSAEFAAIVTRLRIGRRLLGSRACQAMVATDLRDEAAIAGDAGTYQARTRQQMQQHGEQADHEHSCRMMAGRQAGWESKHRPHILTYQAFGRN